VGAKVSGRETFLIIPFSPSVPPLTGVLVINVKHQCGP